MKHTILSLLVILAALAIKLHAVPAYPYPVVVNQPDGSSITLIGHGDEFYNFNTTADGYTVLKNNDGFWVYATKNEAALAPSNVVAHDAVSRTDAEKAFVATLQPRMLDETAVAQSKKVRAKEHAPAKISNNYKNYRGLIILINFNDKQFTRTDAAEHWHHVFNDKNYTGYTNEDGSANAYGKFTGSVNDYFRDNSDGIFDPSFDVVGPYTVNYSVLDGHTKYRTIFADAVKQAYNDGVDMSKYDTNGDKTVEMVYFIVAGHGSNTTGNNSGYLWPHKSSLQVKVGNYWVTTYASSTELRGSENTTVLDGIGTVCHEFTHVLGFPDLYDINYETDGQSHHPGEWDVMAGGSYHNNSRTPAGYTAFERYALGFKTPKTITGPMECTLNALGTSGDAYILRTPVAKEYFILENRQPTKWDYYLPGTGMLVARVDSTESWSRGVNINPEHNHYELVRAGCSKSGSDGTDPFPGSLHVSLITNDTQANIKNWNGTRNQYNIMAIKESSNGVVTFKVVKEDGIQKLVEDFEEMPVTAASGAKNIEGRFANWDFTKSNVATAPDSLINGLHAVVMKKPSAITMTTPINKKPYMVTANVANTGSLEAKFVLYYSVDNGETWTAINDAGGIAAKKSLVTMSWNIPEVDAPVMFRLNQTSGSTTAKNYLDDFSIFYDGEIGGVLGDINADGAVNVSDVTTLVNMILGIETINKNVADVNKDNAVNVTDVTTLVNIILGSN